MEQTKLEIIDFGQVRKGDLIIVPHLTRNAELSVCEIVDVYADNFEAKGITGLIKKPTGDVCRVRTVHHPLRIEIFKSR